MGGPQVTKQPVYFRTLDSSRGCLLFFLFLILFHNLLFPFPLTSSSPLFLVIYFIASLVRGTAAQRVFHFFPPFPSFILVRPRKLMLHDEHEFPFLRQRLRGELLIARVCHGVRKTRRRAASVAYNS